LVVTNALGSTDDAFKDVTVTAPVATNIGPTAAFVSTKNGLQLTVTPTGSTDPDGTINKYAYSWGDGVTTTNTTAGSVTHTYGAGGSYKVSLVATDNAGATGSVSHTVLIDAPFVSVRALSTATPSQSVSFHPPTGQNMQCFAYDPVHDQWYLTQNLLGSNGKSSPYETVKIVRMSSNGTYLDSMTLTDGGHGTSMVVENVGSKVYIWITYAHPALNSPNSNDIVRFPYAKGTFTRSKIAGLTKLPDFFPGDYKNYFVDWGAGWVLEKHGSTYRRRKLSEYLKGIDKTYGSTFSTSSTLGSYVLQGFASMNDTLYVYTGAQNGEDLNPADPATIWEFDWVTGNLLEKVNVNKYGLAASGVYHEPEGLAVVRDAASGKGSLLFGINTGIWPDHHWLTWKYKNIGTNPNL
jgi:PKD repeat protein